MKLISRFTLVGVFSLGFNLASANNAVKESVYACNFNQSAGLHWQSGSWETTTFKPKNPFYLRTINGRLTTATVDALTRGHAVCNYYGSLYPLETCVSNLGDAISFQSAHMLGAYIDFVGSSTNDTNYKESIFVSPFSCQKL